MKLLICTVGNEREAKRLSEVLVKEKLAACVNINSDVQSVYRWKDSIEKDNEALLLIKSTDEREKELINRIKDLHSYDNPEILSFDVSDGSENYIEWVENNVR